MCPILMLVWVLLMPTDQPWGQLQSWGQLQLQEGTNILILVAYLEGLDLQGSNVTMSHVMSQCCFWVLLEEEEALLDIVWLLLLVLSPVEASS